MVSKESLGVHSLFHFEGITWGEPAKGPVMKTENFSRRTQNCASQAGFGDGLTHKKKNKFVFKLHVWSTQWKSKEPQEQAWLLNSVCLHGSRKGIGLCGLSWVWLGFFLNLVFLFYYLPWRRKRGKERNGDGFFLLDRKKRENIWEEGTTICKLCINSQQHKMLRNSREVKKALFVTLIICFDFSLNVT